jgi:alpha-L-rhamnosidase
MKAPGGIVVSQMMPSVKVTNTFKAIAKTNPKPGVYLFDMGQNFSGWWKIKVTGAAGLTVRVRGAETLNDSLFPKPLTKQDQLSKKQPYQSRIWTDYTLKGKGIEVYEPKFFYTGFRYVEVTPYYFPQIVLKQQERKRVCKKPGTACKFREPVYQN